MIFLNLTWWIFIEALNIHQHYQKVAHVPWPLPFPTSHTQNIIMTGAYLCSSYLNIPITGWARYLRQVRVWHCHSSAQVWEVCYMTWFSAAGTCHVTRWCQLAWSLRASCRAGCWRRWYLGWGGCVLTTILACYGTNFCWNKTKGIRYNNVCTFW